VIRREQCRSIPASGRICRARIVVSIPCLFVLVCLAGPVAADMLPDTARLTPSDWRERLREHTDDFATARLLHRDAIDALERDDPERARALLAEAVELDPRFDAPRRTRAAMELRSGRLSALAELHEAARDRVAGYRNQATSLANALLTFDVAIGILLVWVSVAFLLRYLPFVHHRLAQRVLGDGHRRRTARLLWPAVLAPMLAVASWGLIPWLALTIPLIWVHADRRPRAILSVLLGLLVIQALWPRPFAAVLAGTDPSSLPALVERAAYEPPTEMLRGQLRERLETHPRDADLLLAEGLLLARRGEFRESSDVLLDHLEHRPDDVTATNNLAANHFFLGDVDRAVAGFQRAAALDSLRSVPFYNLSQAYLHKLFLKEGGRSLEKAQRLGFAVTEQVERLPRGAVYFLRPSLSDTWRLAWNRPGDLDPFEALGARWWWLGVPAAHVGPWLVAILGLSVFLGLVVPRRRMVFECVNCGTLACRHCRGEHEGAVLCSGCGQTARRAKSEMVLSTLLRNRRRDAEAAYQRRMASLDSILPGAGSLADGGRRRGTWSAALMSASLTAIVLGGPPLTDPWQPTDPGIFGVARICGVVLLVLIVLLNTAARGAVRGRHLQPHPNSVVSLAGLIEGRAPQRERAVT